MPTTSSANLGLDLVSSLPTVTQSRAMSDELCARLVAAMHDSDARALRMRDARAFADLQVSRYLRSFVDRVHYVK